MAFFRSVAEFFQRLERFFLYVIILFLIALIAWPGLFSRDDDDGSGTDDDKPPITTKEIIDEIRQHHERNSVQLGEIEQRLGRRLTDIDTELAEGRTRAETLQSTVTAIQGALVGIEPRIAQAICNRLKQGMCTGGTGEVTGGALALLVESNFTLLFENARLDENGKVSERSAGIRLTHAHQQQLDEIVRAFRPCNTEREVAFEIHGFSSTAEFQAREAEREEPLPKTDEYNLETARLRAHVVAEYLGEAGFITAPVELKSDLSALERPYVDDAIAGETDQEALNRSVFIKVMAAGACASSVQQPSAGGIATTP